jgi:hypothetical protein
MGKSFNVTDEFLVDVLNLVENLNGKDLSVANAGLRLKILNYLKAKQAAIERRELYRAYRSAKPGSAERENNRQSYLDAAGIHPDWRSEKEINDGPE